jgi:hypothetical protein
MRKRQKSKQPKPRRRYLNNAVLTVLEVVGSNPAYRTTFLRARVLTRKISGQGTNGTTAEL